MTPVKTTHPVSVSVRVCVWAGLSLGVSVRVNHGDQGKRGSRNLQYGTYETPF